MLTIAKATRNNQQVLKCLVFLSSLSFQKTSLSFFALGFVSLQGAPEAYMWSKNEEFLCMKRKLKTQRNENQTLKELRKIFWTFDNSRMINESIKFRRKCYFTKIFHAFQRKESSSFFLIRSLHHSSNISPKNLLLLVLGFAYSNFFFSFVSETRKILMFLYF